MKQIKLFYQIAFILKEAIDLCVYSSYLSS